MDKEFNTTFIPKQTMVPKEAQPTAARKQPMGFLSLIAVVLVIAAVASFGVVYLMEAQTLSAMTKTEEQIASIRADFDEDFLEELKTLDRQLKSADSRLESHIGFSAFLRALGDQTLPTVRFNNLTFTAGGDALEVEMSGEASSYKAIAQQSRLLNESPFINEHIFSGLQRNTENLRVSFSLGIELDPDALSYAEQVAL